MRPHTLHRRVLAGLAAGVALLVLDGLLHANPLAQRLYSAYAPMSRSSVNAFAGSAIDLAYGVILTAIFVMLRPSLPGKGALTKGLSYAGIVWFFRVVMRVASEWVMTTVPIGVHLYTLGAGLVQLLIVAGVIALLLPDRLGSSPA